MHYTRSIAPFLFEIFSKELSAFTPACVIFVIYLSSLPYHMQNNFSYTEELTQIHIPHLEGTPQSFNLLRWTSIMVLQIFVAYEGDLVGAMFVTIICSNIKG